MLSLRPLGRQARRTGGTPASSVMRRLRRCRSLALGVAWLAPATLAACAPREQEETGEVGIGAQREISRTAITGGFSTPESVRYDREQDVYFVTNINGSPSAKTNDGFISRVRADGTIDSLRFIAGARGGVTLHAPKGMAVTGDTLWVADIDAIRAFNRRTGVPLFSIDLAGRARFLNGVVAGADGAVYVSDTGIEFDAEGQVSHPGPDRVFQVRARGAEVVVEGPPLAGPNGLAWDEAGGRLLIASFLGSDILAWAPGQQTPTVVASGPGQFDGMEILQDGRTLISSWADSTIHVLAPGGSTLQPLITGVPAPADIGIDTRRNRVAIPLFMADRVEFWQLD